MKNFVLLIVLALCSLATAQTGNDIVVAFGLTPVTLPGIGSSVTGAESDTLLPFTTYNWIGLTTITSTSYTYLAPRYTRIVPQIGTFLNNHSQTLDFSGSDVGITMSAGLVSVNGKTHWGESAGISWLQNINNTWGMNFNAEWFNPVGYEHNTYKVSVGPTLKF